VPAARARRRDNQSSPPGNLAGSKRLGALAIIVGFQSEIIAANPDRFLALRRQLQVDYYYAAAEIGADSLCDRFLAGDQCGV
jgi:hypothetical protein